MSTSNFTGFIMEFTKTENILIIYRNKQLRNEMIALNIGNLGKSFQLRKKDMMEKEAA